LETTPAAPTTATNAGAVLPATKSRQIEGGVKVEPWKGLLLQAAYFDINRGSTFVDATNTYVQDGRATYKGFEFSATGELTQNWSLYASALFLKAKQATGAPTRTTPTFVPTVVGLRIESTPKRTFSLSSEYRFEEWFPGVAVTGAVYYTGNQAINSVNSAFIPSVTLFDMGLSYKREVYGYMTTFRLNGQNITDKNYFGSTGASIIAKGTPRTIKFSVGTEF
jgi:iron complex outermembrane receptor protein